GMLRPSAAPVDPTTRGPRVAVLPRQLPLSSRPRGYRVGRDASCSKRLGQVGGQSVAAHTCDDHEDEAGTGAVGGGELDAGGRPRGDGRLDTAVAAHVSPDDHVTVVGCATETVTEVAALQHDGAARGRGRRDGYESGHHVVTDRHGRRTGAQRECNESEDQPGETLHNVLLSAETMFCTFLTSMYCFIAPQVGEKQHALR